MQKLNIRYKLGLLILTTLIPIIILIGINIGNQYEVSKENSLNNLKHIANTFSAEQSQTIEGARQLLISLSVLPFFKSFDAIQCENYLSELIKNYKRYANFSVADKNGEIVCSAIPNKSVINVANTKIFKDALTSKGLTTGEYQIGQISKKPVLNFGLEIKNAENDTVGVVFSSLDLSWVNEFLSTTNLGDGGVFLLLDQNGTILARNPKPEKWIGKTFPNDPLIKKVLDTNEATAEATGVDGVRRLYAYKRLTGVEKHPAHVVVGVPYDSIFKEANNTLVISIAFLILTTTLVIFISWKIGSLFLLKQIESLQFLDQQKNEFISITSHQLRTPLSGIRMLLEILLGEDLGRLNNKQKKLATDINDSNDRMINLVNALLDVSKIELKKLVLNPEVIDLKILLQTCLKELRIKMRSKKISSTLNIAPGIRILADQKFISQVFLNIIDNAIKYSPANSQITVRVSKKAGFAYIKIIDKGIGIAKNEGGEIFQKFYRAKSTANIGIEGNGLGLYIAKGIVEESGGAISFESKEGKGTIFTIKLPLYRA